jgi:hypothetical protein
VTLPAPQPGLVIRYSYLWADDAAQGREEGTKERPAAVVLVVDEPRAGSPRVYVLPITHSAPAKGVEAIEVPAAVARKAGLDAARSWIILSEFNEFIWPGFDLAIIPGSKPPSVAYGFLTPGFFSALRDRWLDLDAAAKSRAVPRDGG